jgi:glycosyltransferase involved in cell wall biosynthesis
MSNKVSKKSILFISWDGTQTSYIKSLFLPIFRNLKEKYDYNFHIIQFTWSGSNETLELKSFCEQNGIAYKKIKVFRKQASLGLLKAIFFQSRQVLKYIKANDIDTVMPRGTTSAMIFNSISSKAKVKYLYDADGFSQDERVDFGSWTSLSFKYRIYRDSEFKAIHKADGIIVRSSEAANILSARAGSGFKAGKITVINNGKDPSDFTIKPQSELLSKGLKFIYVGSIGPQYKLDNMLSIYQSAFEKDNTSSFTILTGNQELVREKLSRYSTAFCKSVILKKVDPSDVPSYIAESDVGFALREANFSMKGVAPIKLSEYLLCGIPVIASKGIGDSETYLQNTKAAFLLGYHDECKIDEIISWCTIVKSNVEIRKEARAVGLKYFNLNQTVELYHKAIENL